MWPVIPNVSKQDGVVIDCQVDQDTQADWPVLLYLNLEV